MLYNFDLGDRIPEGFIPDSSLSIAGKAIEEVAKRRWLNAEELLLLLMLPNSLNIEYLNALPSTDHPPKGMVSISSVFVWFYYLEK